MMPICQRQTKNVTFVAQRLFKSIVIWFVYVTISEQRLMKYLDLCNDLLSQHHILFLDQSLHMIPGTKK